MTSTNIPTIGNIPIPRKSPHLLKLRQAVRANIPNNQRYILGLSGGADSLALAAALQAEHISFEAVIVDHQLQPNHKEFSQQAQIRAEQLGIKATIIPVEVKDTGIGMEAAARQARFEALLNFNTPIILAHTRNDQAETMLLKTARNGGIRSLVGMQQVSKMQNVEIYRPLLEVGRASTIGTCKELKIQCWDDPHNENQAFRRVAIRKTIIPALSSIFKCDITKKLSATSKEIAEYIEIVDSIIAETAEQAIDNNTIVIGKVQDLQPVIVQGVVVELLRRHNIEYRRSTVEAITALINNYTGQGAVHLSGAKVIRKQGLVILEI